MTRHFRTAPASLKTDATPAPASTAKTPAQLAAERDMGVMRKPLSPSEQASLNAFENSIANESLDRQHVAKQGREPIMIVMRDEGAMLNALASASKIAAQLIALHGLNAPNKTLMLTDAANPQEITFRVVEGKDGAFAPIEGTAEPVADSQ
jgi:hypothetical protein